MWPLYLVNFVVKQRYILKIRIKIGFKLFLCKGKRICAGQKHNFKEMPVYVFKVPKKTYERNGSETDYVTMQKTSFIA